MRNKFQAVNHPVIIQKLFFHWLEQLSKDINSKIKLYVTTTNSGLCLMWLFYVLIELSGFGFLPYFKGSVNCNKDNFQCLELSYKL